MRIATSTLAGGLTAALLLSGCGRHHHHAAEAAPVTQAPLPTMPDWATPLIGKSVLHGFQASKACKGAFDVVALQHGGASPGVEADGWSWLTGEKRPPDQIVFVDDNNTIVGAATTVNERPDVSKAVKEVTVTKVGWHGVIGATTGTIHAYALLPGSTLCPFGDKTL